MHLPLQKLSADVRVPDLETEGKVARRMSGSVVGLISSSESTKTSNLASQFLRTPVMVKGPLLQTPIFDYRICSLHQRYAPILVVA